MGKTSSPQKKPTISTNAIFKKPAKEALRTVKASKVPKASKQRPEHQLSAAFSASIEQSREHISDTAVSSCDAAYTGLSERLTETNEQYDKKEQEVVNLAGQITAPFKTEELGWTSTDGKQSGTVVLSNRMKKLQKTVDVEEKELIRQWDEWVDSEAELDQLAAEVAAPAVAGNVHTYLALSADEREMMDEIKAEVDRFQKMMKEAAEASLKAMKESEKELNLKQKRIQDQLVAVLREDYCDV